VQVPQVTVIVIALGYNVVRLENVDTTADAFVPIAQEVDRVYKND
jgi:hypothetical protein